MNGLIMIIVFSIAVGVGTTIMSLNQDVANKAAITYKETEKVQQRTSLRALMEN